MRAKLTGTAVALGLALLVRAAPAISEGPHSREFRPSACMGAVFEGAESGALECTKVTIDAYTDGSTSILFTAFQLRDGQREWVLLRAAIKAGDVAGATGAEVPAIFPVAGFYIQRVTPEPRGAPRWPLQGRCIVSIRMIECRTNDATGGFAMRASP
jgi:hypothetical protein